MGVPGRSCALPQGGVDGHATFGWIEPRLCDPETIIGVRFTRVGAGLVMCVADAIGAMADSRSRR
jgi:hypothetical protein